MGFGGIAKLYFWRFGAGGNSIFFVGGGASCSSSSQQEVSGAGIRGRL